VQANSDGDLRTKAKAKNKKNNILFVKEREKKMACHFKDAMLI
jgi:hypothetical protein